MKITVLAGGLSPEREVSLTSGSLIANALMERGHRVLLLDVYEGIDELPSDPEELFRSDRRYSHRVGEEVPDLEALKKRVGNGKALIGKNVTELCRMSDRVFLALHGGMGENGQLQAYLDCCGISYTGSGYDGCVLSMDKDVTKRLLREAGVPTADWVRVEPGEDRIEEILNRVGLPCVVKPTLGGSSVGVAMVDRKEQLRAALAEAAKNGESVLAERRLFGRELTVGVLDGETLPAIEIIPKEGFYDYKNKYQGTTEEICPAPISEETAAELARLTRIAFGALRLRQYARLDYILDQNGKLWCLEANALPGMTPTSLLPLSASAVGISYGELCERILQA